MNWICWEQKPKYILMRYISLSDQFGDDNKNDENEYLLKFHFTHTCESMQILNTYIWTP